MKNKPIIWLYWENSKDRSEEPELIKRCKKLYQKYDNIVIVNDVTIKDYLPELIDCSKIKFLAQKVDYYRSKLLYTYGGIWLDFDMILLNDVTYLYDELIQSDFDMIGKYKNKECSIPFLIFKPKTEIAKLWYIYCENHIKKRKYIKWATLGALALGKVIHYKGYEDKVRQIPDNLMYSLGYRDKKYESYYSTDEKYIEKILNEIKSKKSKIITLYGTFMYNIPITDNCLLDKMFKLGK